MGFPSQLVPLAIVRMFSSSAATGLVLDVFKEYGTDSRIGLIASIMMNYTGVSKNAMYKPLKKTGNIRQIIHRLWIVSENQSCIMNRMKKRKGSE